ncbi:MAG: SMP-30/gluconolactonase/LRE family protein [Bacteroidetes bacterium]|nr:SMP-30/gluconolactonase/LRE family protein [Bacteroidota bacterium]
MSYHIEQIGETLSFLGEGPVWDDQTLTLLWVDILDGYVHELDPATGRHTTHRIGEPVGVVALCLDGRLVAGLKGGFSFLDRLTGQIVRIDDPEVHLPGNRFNDGKCDPAGRFWAGTMPLTEDKPTGSLYMMGPDRNAHRMATAVTISNGLAWSLDHRHMYYIDTPTMCVARFDYDAATGSIGTRDIAIRIPREDGYPDGMTIDVEGMLWIAHWGGWQLTRWDPSRGVKLDAIRMPVSNVTSCTFGGPGFTDLYVTSARKGLTEVQLASQPLAGALFVVRETGFRGMPAHRYLG